MEKQKETSERQAYRRACKHYSYGNCCAQSGWLSNGTHITIGCDGGCRRMKNYDKKHGLQGPFEIEY